MPPVSLDAALAQFKPDDYTVRLVNAIFKVVPYSPELKPYRVMEDVVKASVQTPDAMMFAKARQQSMNQDVQDVVWMAGILDSADKGIAMFSGFKAAYNMLKGHEGAAETDPQQRNDAVLKAIGLSYMAYNAFPGTIAERAEAFRTSQAGQALLLYYASMEVALPFADNLATGGGNLIDSWVSKDATTQASRLASLGGGKDMGEAVGMLQQMTGGIQRVVDHASKYAKPIAESARQYAPGALGTADKVAGAVATAADLMPVYTYLGGRLAAEAAVYRAMRA